MRSIVVLSLLLPAAAHAQVLVAGRPIDDHRPQPVLQQRMSCDTTLLFYTSTEPQGLAVTNDLFWVMYPNSPWVVAYDDTGAPQDSLDIGIPWDNYGGLFQENGNLWLMREQAAQLYHFSLGSGMLLNMFQLPMIATDPNYWGIERVGTNLVVSFYNSMGGTKLYHIDPSNGAVVDSALVSGLSLLELQTVNGDLFGIQAFGETMYHVDPFTGSILGSLDWCLPYALGADVSPAHGLVGVEGWVPAVYVVDSNTVTGNPETAEGSFILYPNPAADVLTIDLAVDEERSIDLRSMDGRLVRRWRIANGVRSFSLADVPCGSYVAMIEGSGSPAHRLVIAR